LIEKRLVVEPAFYFLKEEVANLRFYFRFDSKKEGCLSGEKHPSFNI